MNDKPKTAQKGGNKTPSVEASKKSRMEASKSAEASKKAGMSKSTPAKACENPRVETAKKTKSARVETSQEYRARMANPTTEEDEMQLEQDGDKLGQIVKSSKRNQSPKRKPRAICNDDMTPARTPKRQLAQIEREAAQIERVSKRQEVQIEKALQRAQQPVKASKTSESQMLAALQKAQQDFNKKLAAEKKEQEKRRREEEKELVDLERKMRKRQKPTPVTIPQSKPKTADASDVTVAAQQAAASSAEMPDNVPDASSHADIEAEADEQTTSPPEQANEGVEQKRRRKSSIKCVIREMTEVYNVIDAVSAERASRNSQEHEGIGDSEEANVADETMPANGDEIGDESNDAKTSPEQSGEAAEEDTSTSMEEVVSKCDSAAELVTATIDEVETQAAPDQALDATKVEEAVDENDAAGQSATDTANEHEVASKPEQTVEAEEEQISTNVEGVAENGDANDNGEDQHMPEEEDVGGI